MLRKLLVLTAVAVTITGTATAQASSKKEQVANKIVALINTTHYRQSVMHVTLTRSSGSFKRSNSLRYIKWVERKWEKINYNELRAFRNPPHLNQFMCIHHYEGSWTDTGSPYYGGLQMDDGFQTSYAPQALLEKGTANKWSPLEQIWTAEQAFKSRGYWPWPNTARYCSLI